MSNQTACYIKTGRNLFLSIAILLAAVIISVADCYSQVWAPIGNELDGSVSAFTVYNNELIIGGSFRTAGNDSVKGIAKWNGSSWVPLGSGMGGTSPYVKALTVYNGELIAAGQFTTAGGVTVNRIAKWNGTSWSALGIGLSSGLLQTAYALAVFNNELVVAGSFWYAGTLSVQNIAKWDGTSWSALAGGLNTDVYSLTIFNGELIAAGRFSNFPMIAKWNGTAWSGLGSGFNNSVFSLVVYNNELIAGGGFTTAGGSGVNRIAKWNGSSWSALSSGIYGGSQPIVYSLAVFNNELFAGGLFSTAGSVSANNIAKWNGSSWSAAGLGMNNYVGALFLNSSELMAGGAFTTAGGLNANFVAHWGNFVIHDIITGPFMNLPLQVNANTNIPVKAKVFNNGTVTEPSAPVKFYVNGSLVNTIYKNLSSAQTDSVVNSWTPASTGTYNLMYITSLPQDTNRYNDTVKATVYVFSNMTSGCIGTDTISTNYPFPTYYKNGRTKLLFRSSELNALGLSANKSIISIGFDVVSYSPQVMNGFNVRFKHTSDTLINIYDSLNWSTAYSGSYAVGGTGLQYIVLPSPYFVYNGTSNLIVEICYSNTTYTQYTKVRSTVSPSYLTKIASSDNTSGCLLSISTTSYRPNICFQATTATYGNNSSNSLPGKYSLSQNYPNPFNPVTRINYDIPGHEFVNLKVFDLLGREVKSLVNEMKAPGYYSLDFDGSELPSGVYFYRIQSGGFSDIKKMILIK